MALSQRSKFSPLSKSRESTLAQKVLDIEHRNKSIKSDFEDAVKSAEDSSETIPNLEAELDIKCNQIGVFTYMNQKLEVQNSLLRKSVSLEKFFK